jgi:integrase
MPRTRSPNEGTIYRDRRTGRYVARLPARYGRQSRAGFRTRTEALEWLRQELARRERNPVPLAADRTTVAEYLAYWLRQVAPTMRPSSVRHHTGIRRRYLIPALGAVPLGRLQPTQIQDFYTALRQGEWNGRRPGPATLLAVHATLRRALRCAVQWGLLERSPLERVVAPPSPRPRVAYWTPAEVCRFLEAVRGHPWESLYVVAAYTGLRQGELLALRWEDVDLARGVVVVRRTAQRVPRQGWVFGPPKTGRERAVPLAPRTREVLRALWVRERAAGQEPAGLIWRSPSGDPLTPQRLREIFVATAQAAGLPRLRFHDLRHTTATLCLQAGVPLRVVAELLGHTNPAMTAAVYTHVPSALVEAAVQALDGLVAAAGRAGTTPGPTRGVDPSAAIGNNGQPETSPPGEGDAGTAMA